MKRAKKRPLPSAILLTKMLSYRAAAQKAGMYNIPESAYIANARAGQRVIKVKLVDL